MSWLLPDLRAWWLQPNLGDSPDSWSLVGRSCLLSSCCVTFVWILLMEVWSLDWLATLTWFSEPWTGFGLFHVRNSVLICILIYYYQLELQQTVNYDSNCVGVFKTKSRTILLGGGIIQVTLLVCHLYFSFKFLNLSPFPLQIQWNLLF